MRSGRTFVRFSRSVQLFLQQNVGTDLHRTPETFLSCIHCRFSLATLFPASLAPDFFTSSRDNNTTEKFRGRFDWHDSQVLAPRGLISINCGAMLPSPSTTATRSVLQGGNSARRTRGYEPPFSPETT